MRNIYTIGILANIFEWFEFSIFNFLAGYIGQIFFSTADSVTGLINGFMMFAMSYLVRPLGSLVFGLIADQKGNQFVLQLSLILMAIPTLLIGFLPVYSQIGVFSTFLLLMLRLIQGFAMAGELPSSARYVFENSKKASRSLTCSIAMSSTTIGVLLGSLTVIVMNYFLDDNALLHWGWRLPFLGSMPLAFLIIYFRYSIYKSQTEDKKIVKINWFPTGSKAYLIPCLKGMAIISFSTVCFYTCILWMPSYLHYFLKIDRKVAQLTNIVTLLTSLPFYFVAGYLSQKFKYINTLKIGTISILFSIFPIFYFLQTSQKLNVLLFLQLIFILFFVMVNSVTIELLIDLFPFEHRSLGLSIAWALPSSIIGGTTPWLYSYVINTRGWTLFPAFYVASFALFALFIISTLEPKKFDI